MIFSQRHFFRALRSVLIFTTLILIAGLLGTAQAGTITSSIFIPFAGTVFHEGTSENVSIFDEVHIVTQSANPRIK